MMMGMKDEETPERIEVVRKGVERNVQTKEFFFLSSSFILHPLKRGAPTEGRPYINWDT
jgi:hypothetical protein